MSPRHFLRAMQPLRASVFSRATTTPPTTTTIHPLLPSTSSILSGPLRRLNSTTTTTTTTEPADQLRTAEAAATSTTAPPSLRSYPYSTKLGTVVSVGKMQHTVRVNHRHTEWDAHLRKPYPKVTTYKVSDPRDSLREGDVIEFTSGAPRGRHVRHVVERIVAPFGSAVEERPAVMTRQEREAERLAKRVAKWERREQRLVAEGVPLEEAKKERVGKVRRLVQERVGAWA
ncbi:nucleic acid-binding protein [Aspergillus taichungensis]|uniref:Nucleic acid-binding protein n=1 Tax=Aspergillus taichungensis TaxID=482145 RepID=A0A2J5I460_9EURO|nr:nucleic acid-binding protein [Aspergillus taichungensis]